MVIICVGTPSRADGKLELTHLLEAPPARPGGAPAAGAAPLLLVFRSTMPPGTMETPRPADAGRPAGRGPGAAYEVAFNPEFLRESTAVKDYFAPPKIVDRRAGAGVTRRL